MSESKLIGSLIQDMPASREGIVRDVPPKRRQVFRLVEVNESVTGPSSVSGDCFTDDLTGRIQAKREHQFMCQQHLFMRHAV